jgi:hypothetical protein
MTEITFEGPFVTVTYGMLLQIPYAFKEFAAFLACTQLIFLQWDLVNYSPHDFWPAKTTFISKWPRIDKSVRDLIYFDRLLIDRIFQTINGSFDYKPKISDIFIIYLKSAKF